MQFLSRVKNIKYTVHHTLRLSDAKLINFAFKTFKHSDDRGTEINSFHF